MRRFFFSPDDTGRNEWWTYILTIVLVFSGIRGFGSLPLLMVLQAKGITESDRTQMTQQAYDALFSNNEQLIYGLFPFIVGFLMLLVAFRRIHRKRTISYFTSREKFDVRRFLVGFLCWGLFLGTLFAIDLGQAPETLHWNFQPEKFFALLMICVVLVPLQTGFEELFCRGYVLKGTGRLTASGIHVALINGIVFGGLHSLNPEVKALGWFAMLYFVLSGVFAALVTIMDDGIELSWGYHTANNFFGLLIVSSSWSVLQTDALFIDVSKPAVGLGMIITLAVGYPLMLLVLARLYRWTGWKQRLLGKS